MTGVITKALSGFYYVSRDGSVTCCRARGKFRLDGACPLVGDRADFEETEPGYGIITKLAERKNSFLRPSVANIDLMVILCSAANPVTDPFLIDRVAAIAAAADCGAVICLNKTDMNDGRELCEIYAKTPLRLVSTSALSMEGIEELRDAISGQTCAFTGNSGVGKSSVLNALLPGIDIRVGEVSDKLGRGRHTTRHVELYDLGGGTYIADTPGFASFDIAMMDGMDKNTLQYDFSEFVPFLNNCRFRDCAHINEPGCAVLAAVEDGVIHKSRHTSYKRLRELLARNEGY
jgi:ribosome biogenesis GTPase